MKGGAAPRPQQIKQQLRRERVQQQKFTQPLTGKQARHIATSEAGAEYNPVIRSARGEARGSRVRQGELKRAYGAITAEDQADQGLAAQNASNVNTQINQRLAQAAGADQAALTTQTANDATMAKLLGGPQNTAGLAQAAQGARAQLGQQVALTTPLTAAAANYQNYLGQRTVSARERGVESTGNEANRRAKIKEDVRAGLKQRGQATVKNLNELRQNDREYKIKLRAFPLEKQEQQLKSREAGQSARENANEERRKNKELQNETFKTHHPSSSNGLTADEKNKIREGRQEKHQEARRAQHNANVTARSLYGAAKKPPTTPQQWHAFTLLVAEEAEGADQVNAVRAVERLRKEREGGAAGGGAVRHRL